MNFPGESPIEKPAPALARWMRVFCLEMAMILTAERARELLDYDPQTGKLTWKDRIGNASAGREAGFIYKKRLATYRDINIDGRRYAAHRIIVLIVTGDWPPEDVDHIDGNGVNNKWDNLRCVTNAINARNKRLYVTSSSGFQGVHWDKNAKKWHVQISVDGKKIYLGLFTDKESAILARKAAEKTHGFHENHGRIKQC